MKLALVTDTHFGARSDSPQFNTFFFKFWEQTFFPYLKEHQITTMIHLGDVMDRRKFTNNYIAEEFKTRFMNRLYQDGIETHIIIGNHDCSYKNTNRVNSVQTLCSTFDKCHEPWMYIDPTIVQFDGVPILFVPWICEENYDRSMQLLREAPVSLVMGHLEIAGFEMDRGFMNVNGITSTLFDRFEMVMSGHYHHRSHRGPIHYLGNTYEITWADYDDPRGFHIFDTDTRMLTFVPNPYKMFYKLIYDDTVQNFEFWNEIDFSVYKDTCVKIVVKQKTNPYLFDGVLDKIYASSPLDVSIIENYLPSSDVVDDSIVDQSEDTMTLLSKYIDGLTMDVDATQLKKFMSQLYQDALTAERSL